MTMIRRIAAGAVFACAASASLAQLTPDRHFNGVSRPIRVAIEVPEGATGEPEITLLRAGEPIETGSTTPVEEGIADLATLFPVLWTTSDPSVLYAQLFEGDNPVGAAIVIQPMLTPSYSARTSQRTGKPEWDPSPLIFSGYRAYVEQEVTVTTTEGDITFRMRPDEAPNTVWNFLSLSEGGFYTDIPFHRIIAEFVIQVGDPRGEGNGGPGYYLDLENSKLPHDFGVLSMARSADPNSNGSQVFVCLSRERTKGLDSRYTSFGEAITGADVIMKIANTPLQEAPNNESPVNPPLITSVALQDAAPRGTGAAPVTRPTEESATGGR